MYFFCLSILFTITNSVDPDEMPRYAAFHLIFSVCKSTRLGFYRIERVKKVLFYLYGARYHLPRIARPLVKSV